MSRFRRFKSISSLAFAVGMMSSMPQAMAQSAEDLLRMIENQASQIENLKSLVEQYRAASQHAAEQAAAATKVAPRAAANNTPDIKVKWKGAPELSSADGKNKMKIRGRIMTDAWGVSSNQDLFDEGGLAIGKVDYPSGTELRRARIGVEGQIMGDFKYKAEVDFAGGGALITDMYIEYVGFKPAKLVIGQHKEPFSLDEQVSSRYSTFIERSLAGTLAPGRALGLSAKSGGSGWTFKAGVFGQADDDGVDGKGDESWALGARATFAPLHEKGRILHIGGAINTRNFADANNKHRVRARPEVHLFGRLVETAKIDTDSITRYGVEAAAVFGPLSLQGEYFWQQMDYVSQANATFSGGYAQVSWFLTGESRPYKGGAFGRVKPIHAIGSGGKGALELAARVSTIDLNDAGVFGGQEDNLTLGLNWYLMPYARLMFNWVHFDVDNSFDKRPLGSAFHNGNAFGVRAQVDW